MEIFKYGLAVRPHFNALYGKQRLADIQRCDRLIKWFNKEFNAGGCHLCSASGRVEIVGNHTDHNGGLVLATTINRDILAAFLPRDDGKVVIKSQNFRDIEFTLDEIENRETNSRGIAKGVIFGLKAHRFAVGGFSACLFSDVPGGAGMSSSAAFELVIAQIVNSLYNNGKIPAETLAQVGQFAENTYFNKPCGLLDQSVIALGGIVKLDFSQGLHFYRIENNISGLSFVVINTGGSHSGLTAHYAAIPAEMKAVAAFLGKTRLIDVDMNQFFENFDKIAQTIGLRPALRAKHFFEENLRVLQTVECLQNGNKQGFVDAVNASGQSSLNQLQNCTYDGGGSAIVDAIKNAQKFIGSGAVRVHGGGFAGTILCVVEKQNLQRFTAKMSAIYGSQKVFVLNIRQSGAVVL